MTTPDPELDVAAPALVGAGAQFVVIGGFVVIANRFVRATEDIDILVPGDRENDRRPRDRNDLLALEAIHGELPIDPIPGLDRDAGE